MPVFLPQPTQSAWPDHTRNRPVVPTSLRGRPDDPVLCVSVNLPGTRDGGRAFLFFSTRAAPPPQTERRPFVRSASI
jgi:hypothetical protein